MDYQGTKTLNTERLVLREFVISDANAMYRNWASEDEVTKYLSWPAHRDEEETRIVLSDWIRSYKNPDYFHWGIELKSTGELIGSISVVQIQEDISAAILGWCLGSKWWGQGLMPEAAKRILSYLFDEIGFNRIAASHDKNNTQSGRVMQKIGMTCEGVWRSGGKNNQGIVDSVWYSVLKAEFDDKNK